MGTKTKAITAQEIQYEIIQTLKYAEKEGQPVQEIYEAVRNGTELEAWFEMVGEKRCQLVIAIKEDE